MFPPPRQGGEGDHLNILVVLNLLRACRATVLKNTNYHPYINYLTIPALYI
jgi:hypothetical protein